MWMWHHRQSGQPKICDSTAAEAACCEENGASDDRCQSECPLQCSGFLQVGTSRKDVFLFDVLYNHFAPYVFVYPTLHQPVLWEASSVSKIFFSTEI